MHPSILKLHLKPKTKKRGKTRATQRTRRPRTVTIEGPWGVGLRLPISSLPIKIGSDTSLNPNQSIYPVIHGLSIPISLKFFSFTAGAAANVFAIDATALINAWSTRFANTFDEYCMTGFKFEVRLINTSGIGDGIVYFYLDEKDSGSPTASAAQASPRLDVTLNNAALPTRHQISWLARDLLDLGWTSTSNSTTPVWLKTFASPADTGTNNDTAFTTYITGALNVDFRGFKN